MINKINKICCPYSVAVLFTALVSLNLTLINYSTVCYIAGVERTIQEAAQSVLLSSWSLLLPTIEERAKALSSLLPNGELKVTAH